MIEIKQLTAGYQKEAKIEEVNCLFKEAQMNVILGPNGSGKSTLLKAMLGMNHIFSGEILLGDDPLISLNAKERAQKIAYVPQCRNVPEITVERLVLHGRFPYLSYPRKYQETDYQEVELAIRQMGMTSLRHQPMALLSGGERQKAYLAMALAQDTPVLVLDEPTTFLDIGYQLELMNHLTQLKKKGKTIIIVLHDLYAALTYGDVLLVMHQGRVAGSGTPEQVQTRGLLDEVFGAPVSKLYSQGIKFGVN